MKNVFISDTFLERWEDFVCCVICVSWGISHCFWYGPAMTALECFVDIRDVLCAKLQPLLMTTPTLCLPHKEPILCESPFLVLSLSCWKVFWPFFESLTSKECSQHEVHKWTTKNHIFDFRETECKKSVEHKNHLFISWTKFKEPFLIQQFGNVREHSFGARYIFTPPFVFWLC